MIYAPQNPTGIDSRIYKLQYWLDKLGWGDIYGQLYINNGKAEALVDGEYINVLLDDRKKSVMGFVVNERQGYNMVTASVDLIVNCNLKLLGLSKEEAINEVLQVIRQRTLLKNEKSVKIGSPYIKNNKYPYFNFTITLNVNYKNN